MPCDIKFFQKSRELSHFTHKELETRELKQIWICIYYVHIMLLWEFSHWAEVFLHCVHRQKMFTVQLLPTASTKILKLTNFSLFYSGVGPLSHQRAKGTRYAGALFLHRSLCSFIPLLCGHSTLRIQAVGRNNITVWLI